MLIADTETHSWGWRWLLVDLVTGERVCTSSQTYWSKRHAQGVGDRVLHAAQDWPIHDTTEGP